MVALRFDGEAGHLPATSVPRRSSAASSEPARPRQRGAASGVGPRAALVVVVALLLGGSLVTGDADPGGGTPLAGMEPIAGRPGGGAVHAGDAVHVVQPGESYWSIAVALDGGSGGDVRSLVDALESANGFRLLRAGDRMVVPGAGG